MADVGGDLAALMGQVARLIFSESNFNKALSSKRELRWGRGGSLSVDLEKGTFYDHEAQAGGGVLDLIKREKGFTTSAECIEWLKDNGFQVEGRQRKNGSYNGSSGPLDDGAPPNEGNQDAPTGSREVAWYDYIDEEGTLLFQVVRFEPKDFRQRRRGPNGEWINNLQGVRRVPYRLPELIEAISKGQQIFIVEGEKDVENLRAIGIVATCNPMGAGKWPEEFSKFFTSADAVVIPDHDPPTKDSKGNVKLNKDGNPTYPGQEHARKVCTALKGIANSVKLLNLATYWPEIPEKGDSSDWIEKGGGTAEKLQDYAARHPEYTPEQGEALVAEKLPFIKVMPIWTLDDVAIPDRQWVVDDLIPRKNVTLLSGEGGLGKTLVLQQLAVSVAIGRTWLGREVRITGPVILFHCEDDENEIHFRIDKIRAYQNVKYSALKNLHIVSLAGKASELATVAANGLVEKTPLFKSVEALIKDIQPALVAFDTAADMYVIDERDRSQVRQAIATCRGLCIEHQTTILLLSHPSMSGIKGGSGLSGSTAWNNSVRSRLYMRKPTKVENNAEVDDETSDVRLIETMKSNYGSLGKPLRIRWSAEGLFLPEGEASVVPPSPEKVADKAAAFEKAKKVFKAILKRHIDENRNKFCPAPTANKKQSYHDNFAQTVEATSEKISAETLKLAMNDLINKREIHIAMETKGSPSKRCDRLWLGPPPAIEEPTLPLTDPKPGE